MLEHEYGGRVMEAGTAPQAGTGWVDRRSASRIPVIKSAKLLLGDSYNQSVINCLVLDEAANGVLVDLGTMFVLPEEMVLQMASGPSYRVRRCWSAGSKFGLEFIGGPLVSKEAGAQMAALGRALWTQAIPFVIADLRSQRFFGHEDLRQAAEEAEAAYRNLEKMLVRG
ncbi:MAG: hypothetical protein P4L52_01035 [Acidocella sp.]|nr:hypothetical protein [Acidocella sp.]